MDLYNYNGEKVSNSLHGKKLSILGDSISTYNGYIPTGYERYYPSGDVNDVSKTWWMKLINKSGMTLLKNASWSGSMVSGETVTGSAGCSDARITALKDGSTVPDIIIVFISTNDWVRSIETGSYDSTEDVDTSSGSITNISDAYALMLYKIRTTYPTARVYCLTSLEGRKTTADVSYPVLNNNGESIHNVNHVIAEIAHIFGVKVIDLQTCGIHFWNIASYTVDGKTHPNEAGMSIIADTVYKQLAADFGT